jgi:hypothetical protein
MGVGHVYPHVNVRRTPEIPDERGAFQSPVIVDAIIPKVDLLVEGQVAGIQSTLGLETAYNLVLVRLAKGIEQELENGLKVRFLVG